MRGCAAAEEAFAPMPSGSKARAAPAEVTHAESVRAARINIRMSRISQRAAGLFLVDRNSDVEAPGTLAQALADGLGIEPSTKQEIAELSKVVPIHDGSTIEATLDQHIYRLGLGRTFERLSDGTVDGFFVHYALCPQFHPQQPGSALAAGGPALGVSPGEVLVVDVPIPLECRNYILDDFGIAETRPGKASTEIALGPGRACQQPDGVIEQAVA